MYELYHLIFRRVVKLPLQRQRIHDGHVRVDVHRREQLSVEAVHLHVGGGNGGNGKEAGLLADLDAFAAFTFSA